MSTSPSNFDSAALSVSLKAWARELGFTGVGVARIDLPSDEAFFLDWLRSGFNGEMGYMSRHGLKRSRPADLIPGTVSCISVRMDYWPAEAAAAADTLADGSLAYVSRYALGRDYHKVLRSRLQTLCDRIQAAVGPFGHRVFTDSAPVLEKALARNAGLGWIGKHTNLIHREAGSYFFLGEIYLDLELPADEPSTAHCGSCSACMPACPTGGGHCGALSPRRTPLHFLPDDRVVRKHSGGISTRHRQPYLWMR
jgi:epoxyqueuosine reductase